MATGMLDTCYTIFIVMNKEASVYLTVLTYKGKILLKRVVDFSHPTNSNPWSLFGGVQQSEVLIMQELQNDLGVTIPLKPFMDSTVVSNSRSIYYANLSDKEVNEIQRDDRRELQFFSFHEIEKLILETSAKEMISNGNNTLRAVCSMQ